MISQGQTAKSIFLEAIEKHTPAEWPAFLDAACGGDEQLRARVNTLLRSHQVLGSFHETPDSSVDATIAPPASEQPGTLIGPYKLLEQIGEGGMGLVYMAEQQRPMRRLVALKLIKPGMDSKQVIARFEAEKQALAMMDHENIAKVFEAGTTDTGRFYFAMELVRGMPINEFCDQQRLSVRERLELFMQVCQAVQHAHQKGIIHRDLKPTNVLVTMNDIVAIPKVIDFGIAKALGQSLTDHTLHTGFAQLVGTPLYMSPEQAKLNQLGVDTRSDVYSLGVLLYELLTGTTPFDKETLSNAGLDEMRRMIREDDPPRPSARMSTLQAPALSTISQRRSTDPRRISTTLRGELDWIVMKALEKDRSRRYESASAFATDIQRYLSDEPVLACPPTTMYRFQKFARKHKPALATAAAIALCLILGTTVSAWQAVRATTAEAQASVNEAQAKEAAAAEAQQRQRAEANEQKAIAQRDEAQRQRDEIKALSEKLVANEQQLRKTLYGAHMSLAWHAWVGGATDQVEELLVRNRPKSGETDLRAFEWHYLNRLCHSDLLTLRGHTDFVYQAIYSPDGKRLASASADDTVRIWDAETGQELLVFKGHTGDVNSVAFSPDGGRIASCSGSTRTRGNSKPDGLKVWKPQTGEELLHVPGAYPPVAFSPDGKRLITSYWRDGAEGNTLKVWDAESGKELQSWKTHDNFMWAFTFSPDGKRVTTSAGDKKVKIWDAENEKELLAFDFTAYGLDMSPDGKCVVAVGEDLAYEWQAKVWDISSGENLLTLKDVGGSAVFSPDGKILVSGGGRRDKTMRVWDAKTGQEIRTIKGGGDSVGFSPDGRRLASCSVEGTADYTVRIWDAHQNQESATVAGGGTSAFSPDGRFIATVLNDERAVVIRDTASLRVIRELKGHTVPIAALAFSPDGKRLAIGGGGRRNSLGGTSFGANTPAEVKMWDFQTGQEVFSILGKGVEETVFGLAFSPDGKRLASANKVRDAETGREVFSIAAGRGWGRSVAYSPNGKYLAASAGMGPSNEVKLFNAQTGEEIRTLAGGGLGVAFSADGKRLASAAMRPDTKVWVWDAESGAEIYTVKGGGQGVAFSPDGKRLASGGKIWDAESGHELISLSGGRYGIAFSSDGNRLMNSVGGKVVIWDATPLSEKP